MMPVQGEYLDKHSRKYVAYNPNEFNGPFTWRLSMMAADSDKPGDITTIYTILPIDSNLTGSGGMNLFFNIDGLEDVWMTATRASGYKAARGMLSLPTNKSRTLFGLTAVNATPPVATDQRGSDVAIYFDIKGLPELSSIKRGFSVKANDYNSKSIDKLTADKPLFVTSAGVDDALVTFDISSLDPA